MQHFSEQLDFERGPIRPPSESGSLLLRINRNCPWNRCIFCPVYKGMRFQKRSVDEVLRDIRTVRKIAENIVSSASGRRDTNSLMSRSYVLQILRNEGLTDAYKSVAVWLYRGAHTVFLQDADPLVMKTGELEKVLRLIRNLFPEVQRITAYARSTTTFRLGIEKLKTLREAGLNRIHTGLESGSDHILSKMEKGVTVSRHIAGGRNVLQAGIELSLYIMPGLGGVDRWREHAISSARVVSAIEPDCIRLRTLTVPPETPLYEQWRNGSFRTLEEEQVLREIRLFLEHLSVSRGRLESDHIVNLLGELNGRLPEDIPRMIGLIDRFLSLPEADRLLFRSGRRAGVFQTLDDLKSPWRRALVKRPGKNIFLNTLAIHYRHC